MALLLPAAPARAQQDEPAGALDAAPGSAASAIGEAVLVDGVGGLIVNGTTTGIGQEFFRAFNEFWREKPEGDKFTLTVTERASRRFGSQIFIYLGQKRVYAAALPFKLHLVRAISEQAAEATYTNIISMDMFAPGAADPDLANDEM